MATRVGAVLGVIFGTTYFWFLLLVNVGRRFDRVADPFGSAYGGRVLRRARCLPSMAAAITFGKYIFCKQKYVSTGLLKHEFVHVRQYRELGFVRFLARYGKEIMLHGYDGSPLEEEARRLSGTR